MQEARFVLTKPIFLAGRLRGYMDKDGKPRNLFETIASSPTVRQWADGTMELHTNDPKAIAILSEHLGQYGDRCRALRKDGTQCTAKAAKDGYCIGHIPGKRQRNASNSQKG